jgi:hypothetical protein
MTMTKKKAKKRNKSAVFSPLSKHTRRGNILVPPMLGIPSVHFTSWINDRLPEMIWAALLLTNKDVSRDQALDVFRQVGRFISINSKDGVLPEITLTGLSSFPTEKLLQLLISISAKENHRRALLPLLMFESLPAKEIWAKALLSTGDSITWEPLAHAVARTLDHQSQEATDCRWLRVYCMMIGGKLKLPSEDLIKEIYHYPNFRDMRKVRPSIRACEGSFSMLAESHSTWPTEFWKECYAKTPCIPLNIKPDYRSKIDSKDIIERLAGIYVSLANHSVSAIDKSDIDPRHDTTFGTALFTLLLLRELLKADNRTSISGRLILRTVVECYITLAYLVKKDDEELWKSHRVFGAGQAKLSWLKYQDMETEPEFVDLDMLERLANEDMWLEYVKINLGHWEKSNLRKMSEDCGVKAVYDKYYSWTSAYTHGHWGAIRETVFDTCGNPLHRLHRIPSPKAPNHPDVVPDAVQLIDGILDMVSVCFPQFSDRFDLQKTPLYGKKDNDAP